MNRHIINSQATLLEALQMLNNLSGGAMTLFVCNADGVMLGTLTDGDIRRGMIAGAQPSWRVEQVMNKNFASLSDDTPEDNLEQLRSYRLKGLRLIPYVDSRGKLTRMIDLSVVSTKLPLTTIMMAGGRGERLRPLTLQKPKPLLEIGGKPIIDYNVEALTRVGITDISVTVNYLASQIEEHFLQPINGVTVKCVRENTPMGTIGSAALVEIPEQGDTLVMNSDLLTNISYEDMYLAHKRAGADITVASIPYNVTVPFAILEIEDDRVTALHEKPSYNYYANAGIYIISNRLLRALPKDGRTDATDLLEQAMTDGLKVSYFPITGTWIDIGSPADFARAQEIMQHRSL